jgi:polyisoprenoid-binding protein YceI
MRPLTAFVVGLVLIVSGVTAQAADYTLDTAHTGVYFKIQHLKFSYTFGRFDQVTGAFAFDSGDLAASKFAFTLQAHSVNTGHEKRDNHLRSPDFFNAKQFPEITFTSTKIEAADEPDHFRVTGDLTLLGHTKPITVTLHKLGEGPDGMGKERIGFDAKFTIQRSDFGMNKMLNAIGDEVTLHVSFEGIKS